MAEGLAAALEIISYDRPTASGGHESVNYIYGSMLIFTREATTKEYLSELTDAYYGLKDPFPFFRD